MTTKASSAKEKGSLTSGPGLIGHIGRPTSLTLSNTTINHEGNAADSGIILGISRYGHPDGPVYLPTDREHFDSSKGPWSKYSPTWEQFQQFWYWRERGLLDYRPVDRQRPIPERTLVKLTVANSPSGLVANFNEDLNPDSDRQEIDRPKVKDPLAVVICAPSLTPEVTQRLESNGYEVDPLAFMPFRDKPVPFECKDKKMIIQLGFPRRPRGLWLLQADAIQKSLDAGLDTNYRKGHILMDSLLLHVKDVDSIPTILSFAHSQDVAESMKMTLESNYWKPRFRDDLEGRDLSRRLPLPFFWYAVRRWDEVSEAVDTFIGSLEIGFNTEAAERLHVLRAHILHSEGLLMRFKSIIAEMRTGTKDNIVINECKKLQEECDRFEFQRKMHEERAKHIIDIMHSHTANRVAEASVRDSRDVMQVSRLTMLFLPASVMAGIFGINFDPPTNLILFFILTFLLTVVVIWVFVAMQVENYFKNFPRGAWNYRAFWPFYVFGREVRVVDAIPV